MDTSPVQAESQRAGSAFRHTLIGSYFQTRNNDPSGIRARANHLAVGLGTMADAKDVHRVVFESEKDAVIAEPQP